MKAILAVKQWMDLEGYKISTNIEVHCTFINLNWNHGYDTAVVLLTQKLII